MTERSLGIPVAAIAGALFCVVLIYLALQVRAGADPAIGAGHETPAAQPTRKVLVKRIIVRRIIEEPAASAGGGAASGAPPAAGGGGAARAASAPAPAAGPAPAAAPAPAPVVSGGS